MKINKEQFDALVAKLDAVQTLLKGPIAVVPNAEGLADRKRWLQQTIKGDELNELYEKRYQEGEKRYQEAIAKNNQEFEYLAAIQQALREIKGALLHQQFKRNGKRRRK